MNQAALLTELDGLAALVGDPVSLAVSRRHPCTDLGTGQPANGQHCPVHITNLKIHRSFLRSSTAWAEADSNLPSAMVLDLVACH